MYSQSLTDNSWVCEGSFITDSTLFCFPWGDYHITIQRCHLQMWPTGVQNECGPALRHKQEAAVSTVVLKHYQDFQTVTIQHHHIITT